LAKDFSDWVVLHDMPFWVPISERIQPWLSGGERLVGAIALQQLLRFVEEQPLSVRWRQQRWDFPKIQRNSGLFHSMRSVGPLS